MNIITGITGGQILIKDGLPYIRRDGESNPDAFMYHRFAIRKTRTAISHLTRAYMHTKMRFMLRKQ